MNFLSFFRRCFKWKVCGCFQNKQIRFLQFKKKYQFPNGISQIQVSIFYYAIRHFTRHMYAIVINFIRNTFSCRIFYVRFFMSRLLRLFFSKDQFRIVSNIRHVKTSSKIDRTQCRRLFGINAISSLYVVLSFTTAICDNDI